MIFLKSRETNTHTYTHTGVHIVMHINPCWCLFRCSSCVLCMFSALSRRVGALQIFVIIIIARARFSSSVRVPSKNAFVVAVLFQVAWVLELIQRLRRCAWAYVLWDSWAWSQMIEDDAVPVIGIGLQTASWTELNWTEMSWSDAKRRISGNQHLYLIFRQAKREIEKKKKKEKKKGREKTKQDATAQKADL